MSQKEKSAISLRKIIYFQDPWRAEGHEAAETKEQYEEFRAKQMLKEKYIKIGSGMITEKIKNII